MCTTEMLLLLMPNLIVESCVFFVAEVVGASDVATEVVPIRTTRLRKPTMKAAAEKAPPRATRRGTVMRTVLQPEAQEEQQGENQAVFSVFIPINVHQPRCCFC